MDFADDPTRVCQYTPEQFAAIWPELLRSDGEAIGSQPVEEIDAAEFSDGRPTVEMRAIAEEGTP